MPFLAEARVDIDAPPEVVFDTLADHPSWKDWMPRSFVVASPATGPHYVGNRFTVRVAGLPFPSSIKIVAFDKPRMLAWAGGARGVLHGHHEFRLSSNGKGGTTVVSSERWSGIVARLVRPVLKAAAERVGREQLDGLTRGCRSRAQSSAGIR